MATRIWTDGMGREVAISDHPQRLVSLVPSITELLFDYGFAAQIAAITSYCIEPPQALAQKTAIGGTKSPDIGKILDIDPQLVFAVAEENRRQDVQQLESAGISVYVFAPSTVRDGIDLMWTIAALLDCTVEVSERLEAIESIYRGTLAGTRHRPRTRVFCPIWKDPYMTIGAGTYVDDVLATCGGDNIFSDRRRRFPLAADLGRQAERDHARDVERDRRYPRVTLDEMAAHRPDVILLPDEPYVFAAADVADFEPYRDVPAVSNGRIHLIDGKIVTWYGPRIGRSLQTLNALLNPAT